MSVNFGTESNKLLKYERAKAKLKEFSVISEQRSNRVEQFSSNELLYSTVRVLSQYVESYLNDEADMEVYNDLTFVSHFYENYVQAEEVGEDNLFYLIGAIANILSDNFGNAKSLIGRMGVLETDSPWCRFVSQYIAKGLGAKVNVAAALEGHPDLYRELIQEIDNDIDPVFIKELRKLADDLLTNADSESAFLSLMLCATHKKFVQNSAIRLIPEASNSTPKDWKSYFEQPNAIRILWQAQKLMLKKDVLKGADATIQLPTGVGKTKSVELIISAAFLLRNVSLAIVVAPLRALCNEIEKDLQRSLRNIVRVTALSDVLEDEALNYEQKQVIVLTPEKLSFLIKHNSDIVQKSGLVIFDEAHMFDDTSRGASYELLILQIKELLPVDAQSVFISAIMPNVEELNEWLTEGGQVVSDSEIKRTDKSVAFYSRIENYLYFYQQRELIGRDEKMVYIPSVCPRTPIVSTLYEKGAQKGKTKDQFPDLKQGMDIAIYLACKLSNRENCSAIYVNAPRRIQTLSKRLSLLNDSRCDLLRNIKSESNTSANEKIVRLAQGHLGKDNEYVTMMQLGFFPHFGGLENGLRLSIEHEIRRHNISCVVCTSTLAEGVNLPIKYLFLTSLQDVSGGLISTRKFQNLIGRTARSGVHTEGSLICTDPKYFDDKGGWPQWDNVVSLFDPSKSEHCNSAIKNIFNNLYIPYTEGYFVGSRIVNLFLENYSQNKVPEVVNIAERLYEEHTNLKVKRKYKKSQIVDKYVNTIQTRVNEIDRVVKSIELLIFDEIAMREELSENRITELATETLAYMMSDEETKGNIVTLFQTVARKILELPPDKRRVFSLAMNSHDILLYIDKYLADNPHIYSNGCFDLLHWIHMLNDLLKLCCEANSQLGKLTDIERLDLIVLWISGTTYCEIATKTDLKLDRVMKLCQNDLAYTCNTLLSSVVELLSQYKSEIDGRRWEGFINEVTVFQQRLKYGLVDEAEIAAYEFGYSDRIVAREVGKIIRDGNKTVNEYKNIIKKHKTSIQERLEQFPNYFKEILQ